MLRTEDVRAAPPAPQPLSQREAAERHKQYGPNVLVPEAHGFGFAWIAQFFMDPMVLLLLVVGATYLVLGDRIDAYVAFGALAPIFLVTAVLERRSERALEELKRLAQPTARVRRDDGEREIAASEVVPGDVLSVREGDVFVADGILVAGTRLIVDESALTGESIPVDKEVGTGDVFAGTALRSGNGEVVVTAIGAATRYGRIGTLMSTLQVGRTPLEQTIRRVVWQVGALVVLLCVFVVAIERGHGQLWPAAIIAGASLAMAAIPEELPMVYTLYLALGAWSLAKRHALVRRLASVETLGSASVICVDKTGTLTVGHLEVAAIWARAAASESALLEAAVMACEPHPFDPLDRAILAFTDSRKSYAPPLQDLLERYPFDLTHRRVTHVWRRGAGSRTAVKGAIETIVDLCTLSGEQRRDAFAAMERYAADGMRVIAVAEGIRARPVDGREAAETNLDFLGLIAFSDPVRDDVPAAIEACKAAGIAVIMLTGDHPATAAAVARRLGLQSAAPLSGETLNAMSDADLATALADHSIFARIQPEQKLRIVTALHSRGDVVAMTGDGTNDALALREADIGVAMGMRGTPVARNAADLVLLDDDFATIVGAIAGGRRIFRNLRRAFRYLNAFHAPLIISAVVIPLWGLPLLLLPIHLVWLEIVVHPTSALVYENEGADDPQLMLRPPRGRKTALMRPKDWVRPLLLGSTLAIACLFVYIFEASHGETIAMARGMTLVTMLGGQMLLVLTERSTSVPMWRQSLTENPRLLPILIGTMLSLVAILYVPPVADIFRVSPPNTLHFAQALALAAISTLYLEPFKRSSATRVDRS